MKILAHIAFAISLSLVATGRTQYAYVTILSTNDFLWPARVLGQSLKLLNVTAPFIVLCTEDITAHTKSILHKAGVPTMDIVNIDNPEVAAYSAKKYAFTKINLWKMTNFTSLMYIDSDAIVVQDISELFFCGGFCAVMRHSDKFNAGIFAMKPDLKVYKDLLDKRSLPSYDHGDQGFFNSYFSELKLAPMFDPEDKNWPKDSKKPYRMSAAYNYDLGMHCIGSPENVVPKIIHYTLGPVKPWTWWTYPIFDLNWAWLSVRNTIPVEPAERLVSIAWVALEGVYAAILFFTYRIFKSRLEQRTQLISLFDSGHVIVVFQVAAAGISFMLVPPSQDPALSWSIYLANQLQLLLFFCALRIWLIDGSTPPVPRILQLFTVSSATFFLLWIFLANISRFGTRCYLLFLLLPFWILLEYILCLRLRVHNASKPLRYQLVKKT